VLSASGLSDLSADQKQALSGLSPSDQAAFVTAWKAADGTGRDRLGQLLLTPLTRQVDSRGNTLLANLSALAGLTPPKDAPYKAQDILNETLKHLLDSETIHQDNRNTCTVTTVQFMVLKEQPSEYARLVAGIAGKGEVKLRSGDTLTRVADSIPTDSSSRDDVERLMQSAFMNHGFDLRGHYSNVQDGFELSDWAKTADSILNAPLKALHGLGGWFHQVPDSPIDLQKTAEGMNQGNTEGRVMNLYEQITGHRSTLVGDLPGGVFAAPASLRGDTAERFLAAARAGKTVPVEISTKDLHDDPNDYQEHVLPPGSVSITDILHQILVTGVQGDRVTYRNPWGYETSMSIAEFKSRVLDGIIPD
jgi:hypothetical protein